jgi:hypothetical protein
MNLPRPIAILTPFYPYNPFNRGQKAFLLEFAHCAYLQNSLSAEFEDSAQFRLHKRESDFTERSAG